MSASEVLLLAFLIGVLAGLRSLTAPRRNSVRGAPRLARAAKFAVVLHGLPRGHGHFVLLALGELVADKLPSNAQPHRSGRFDCPRGHGRLVWSVPGRRRCAVAGVGCGARCCGRHGWRLWRISVANRFGESVEASGFCHRSGRRCDCHWRKSFNRFAFLVFQLFVSRF